MSRKKVGGISFGRRNVRKVFAVPMKESNTSALTEFLFDAMDFVLAHPVEGSFRISGSLQEIEALKSRLDKGKSVPVTAMGQVHNVTCLLKQYFRELPEPLFPFHSYSAFVEVGRTEDDRERIGQIGVVVGELELHRQILLKRLMCCLFEMTKHEPVTRMGAVNLGLLFAPNLIRSNEKLALAVMMSHQGSVQKIVIDMIAHYEAIFRDIVPDLTDLRAAFEDCITPKIVAVGGGLLRDLELERRGLDDRIRNLNREIGRLGRRKKKALNAISGLVESDQAARRLKLDERLEEIERREAAVEEGEGEYKVRRKALDLRVDEFDRKKIGALKGKRMGGGGGGSPSDPSSSPPSFGRGAGRAPPRGRGRRPRRGGFRGRSRGRGFGRQTIAVGSGRRPSDFSETIQQVRRDINEV